MVIMYLYFTIVYCSLYGMIFAKSPQRRLLCMIIVLLNYVASFVYLHLEYLAFILLIIYIGAISVLFLFMIMLVNVLKIDSISRNFFLFISVFFICLFFFLIGTYDSFRGWFDLNFYGELAKQTFGVDESFTPFSDLLGFSLGFLDNTTFFEKLDILLNNIELEQLGFMFWTSCLLYVFLLAILLVVAIIGCVLVLKELILSNLTKKTFLKKL